jgi:hypothetical protein
MRKWMRLTALVAACAIVLTACLTKQQQEQAKQIALQDQRLAAVLDDHPYTVTEVRSPNPPQAQRAVVTIAFDDALAPGEYPLDWCDIGGHPNAITGVQWLVDLASTSVAAVTPRWGNVDCFDF